MLGFDGGYPAPNPKVKFWCFSVKISCKAFHRKTYFAQFREFVSHPLSKIADAFQSWYQTLTLLNIIFSKPHNLRARFFWKQCTRTISIVSVLECQNTPQISLKSSCREIFRTYSNQNMLKSVVLWFFRENPM